MGSRTQGNHIIIVLFYPTTRQSRATGCALPSHVHAHNIPSSYITYVWSYRTVSTVGRYQVQGDLSTLVRSLDAKLKTLQPGLLLRGGERGADFPHFLHNVLDAVPL